MFFNRFLKFKEVVAPSSIKWRNIQYSHCNRMTRKIIVWIFAGIVIFLAFLGMVLFKNKNDEFVAGANLDAKCPLEPVVAELALEDYAKPAK